MPDKTTVEDVLDFAIASEVEAAAFYRDLAARASLPQMKATFEAFAREEDGHKVKLEKVKAGGTLKASSAKIADLMISDYVVEVEAAEADDYQAALIVAMKQEKAAFRLYSDLAATAETAALQDVFLALAQEEAKHKLRFEVEYDDVILREN